MKEGTAGADVRVERQQSRGEEIANSASHGAALVACVAGLPLLFAPTPLAPPVATLGSAVFAATMLALFLASTLYHALPAGRAKAVALRLDHGAIYLFIAGSYTPFALGTPAGTWGWLVFGVIWTLAIAGAVLKGFNRLAHPWLSTALYLLMGWLVLGAALPRLEHVAPGVMVFLVAGGVAYTVGVVFFVLDARLRYAHAAWHCLVAAGSGCHFLAVLGVAG